MRGKLGVKSVLSKVVRGALAAAALAWLPPAAEAQQEAAESPRGERPNFLIILCDDLGYGDLACYGHPVIQTPRLNGLAEQGIRFTQCYASAPVCSPSRVGLLTGRTPSRAGVYDWIPNGHPMHLGRNEITIATLLKSAGYSTCHSGKWHCNGRFNAPDQPQPSDHGFDHWFSTQNNAGPSHENPRNFVRNGQRVGPLEGFACQLVADEAIWWLESGRDSESPFFLYVCFHEPHEPVASPPDLVRQYASGRSEDQAQYFANVTNVDRAVGRLLDALDRLELADNTLVFFTSDNGPETLNRYPNAQRSHGSPGPLRGMKLHLYEGGIRVPGIVRFPGRIAEGQICDVPVSNLDLLPTLCELAGVEPPSDRVIDGTSLVPLLRGEPFERQHPLYWHYFRAIGRPKAAMRIGDHMILGAWDGPELAPGTSVHPGDMDAIKNSQLVDFELYDVVHDVAQEHDLADEHPELVEKYRGQLIQRYREVLAEGPWWEFPANRR